MEKRKKKPVRRIRELSAFTLHPVARLAIKEEAAKMGLNHSAWLSQFLIKATGYDALTGKKVHQ